MQLFLQKSARIRLIGVIREELKGARCDEQHEPTGKFIDLSIQACSFHPNPVAGEGSNAPSPFFYYVAITSLFSVIK